MSEQTGSSVGVSAADSADRMESASSTDVTAAAEAAATAAVVKPQLSDIARELAQKTVSVQLSPEGKPYSRADVITAVSMIVGAGALEAVGQREVNLHWELTFKSVEKKTEFLAAKQFEVKCCKAVVGGIRSSTCRMRIFYLPYYVPAMVITEQLKQLGAKLLSVVPEKDKDGCCSNVRRVVVEVDDNEVVPDQMDWQYDGMSGKVLINVLGRPVKCMRCGVRGHRKFECEAPYCSVCRKVGHNRAPECKRQRRTYAAAASGSSEEENMDECISNNDDRVDGQQQPSGDADTDQHAEDKTTTNGDDKNQRNDNDSTTPDDTTTNWADAMESQQQDTTTSKPRSSSTRRGRKKSANTEVIVDHFDGSTVASPAEPACKRTHKDHADAAPSKVFRRHSIGEDVGLDPTAGRNNFRSPVTAPSARQDKTSVKK